MLRPINAVCPRVHHFRQRDRVRGDEHRSNTLVKWIQRVVVVSFCQFPRGRRCERILRATFESGDVEEKIRIVVVVGMNENPTCFPKDGQHRTGQTMFHLPEQRATEVDVVFHPTHSSATGPTLLLLLLRIDDVFLVRRERDMCRERDRVRSMDARSPRSARGERARSIQR